MQSIAVVAVAKLDPALVLDNIAVFDKELLPQMALVVVLVTCTEELVPAGNEVVLKARLCVGGAPVIDQPALGGLIVQLTLFPEGSGSLKDRPFAVSVPLLFTVTVNPTFVPGFMLALSAVS